MAVCPIFGPKLALCCLLVSVWGTVQLCLMGIFFYIRALALLDDLAISETTKKGSVREYLDEVDHQYNTAALNSWIAACLYVVSMVFSIWQFLANRRLSERVES
jgi:ribonuclease kappa